MFFNCKNDSSGINEKKVSFGSYTTDTAKINSWNNAAKELMLSNLDTSFKLSQIAKAKSQQTGYTKGLGMALNNIASYYHNKGDYEQALQNNLSALELYQQAKDAEAEAYTYTLIAQVYKEMSGNERTEVYSNFGIDYDTEAYLIYTAIGDTAGMANSLIGKGIIYRDKAILLRKNVYYDSAFDDFSTAMHLINTTGKGKSYLGKLYNNISQVYTEEKKDYKSALLYLFKAVELNRQQHNLISLSHNYGNISEVYLQQKNKEQALFYSKKMLEAANATNRPSRITNAYNQVFKSYKLAGNYDSALKYYIKATLLNDSLGNIAKTSQVAELQTKYETKKKELMIAKLDAANANKSRSITWLAVVLAAFISLAIGLVVLYQRVQKQKKLLAKQANKLEVMMKELHHRVKNNLQIVSSLLSLQTYKMQDAESINALQASGQRVQAMSLIHQRLYRKEELTSIDVKAYMTDLSNSLISSYGYEAPYFNLIIDIKDGLMDVDQILPLGLIANELITNALKYAYKNVEQPLLHISLMDNKLNTVLSVKDNGKDFTEKIWKSKNDSFGKQLIATLCKQLRATQQLVTNDGTEFIIKILKKAA